jgi:hypothetical protein
MIRYVLLFLLISLASSAQQADKGSIYGGIIMSNATGEYRDYLKKQLVTPTRLGANIGYLVNVQKKSGLNSPIQIGAEFGLVSWGKDNVSSSVGGSFVNNHSSYWLNAVARFRPILSASTFNLFFDLAIGPEFIHSRVTEILSSDETRKLVGITKTAKNFTLGVGIGIKKMNRNQKLQYVDLGAYFQYTDKVTTIRRNSAYISVDGIPTYAKTIIKPNTFQLRLNLTGFL